MNPSRILLVEDNFVSALINGDFLRQCGFDVTHAATADDAFAILGAGGPLDALVTDIQLGPGANGFDVARAARRAYPDLPVVITSGVRRERFPGELVEGAAFLAKPFHPLQILESLGADHERAVA